MMFTSKNLTPLTLDEIERKAPAVFSNAPAEHVSDKYLFVSTEKLLSGLMNNGWSVVSACQTNSKTADKKMTSKHSLMLCRNDMLTRDFSKRGDVMPLLKFTNAHDARSSFQLQAGLFRLACANGLTVPDTMLYAPKLVHTTSLDRDTIEASFSVVQKFPQLMESIEMMKSVELHTDEIHAFSNSAARLLYTPEQIERTNNMIRNEAHHVHNQLTYARRQEDKKNDLWTVLNKIQENAIRGGVTLVGETNKAQRTRAVNNIDRDSKINQELMMLANEMAKLKGFKVAA